VPSLVQLVKQQKDIIIESKIVD